MKPGGILSATVLLAGCVADEARWRYVPASGERSAMAVLGRAASEPVLMVGCLPTGNVTIEVIDPVPVERWPQARLTAGSADGWLPLHRAEDGLVSDTLQVPGDAALIREWLSRGSVQLDLGDNETMRIPAVGSVRRALASCVGSPDRDEPSRG